MKKYFITIMILFICSSGQAQTNTYHFFPDSAYWRVDAKFQWTTCFDQYFYHYYFKGDTSINSDYYKKLIRSTVLYIGDSSCFAWWPWVLNTGYLGAIRDDSTENKTFYIPPGDSIEMVLFDYNMVVGDTIKGVLEFNNTTIISIDSVIINNQERKRWNFNSGYIIQGIGSSKGLIEKLDYGGPGISDLICVNDSNSIIFNSGINSFIGCQLITSINNFQPSTSEISIFPNPSTGVLNLSSQISFSQIEILDLFGNIIYKSSNLNGQINLSDKLNGVYIIRITKDNNVIRTEKVIIIH